MRTAGHRAGLAPRRKQGTAVVGSLPHPPPRTPPVAAHGAPREAEPRVSGLHPRQRRCPQRHCVPWGPPAPERTPRDPASRPPSPREPRGRQLTQGQLPGEGPGRAPTTPGTLSSPRTRYWASPPDTHASPHQGSRTSGLMSSHRSLAPGTRMPPGELGSRNCHQECPRAHLVQERQLDLLMGDKRALLGLPRGPLLGGRGLLGFTAGRRL